MPPVTLVTDAVTPSLAPATAAARSNSRAIRGAASSTSAKPVPRATDDEILGIVSPGKLRHERC